MSRALATTSTLSQQALPAGLDPARRLYESAGFALRDEQEGESWGTRVVEQLFVLELGNR